MIFKNSKLPLISCSLILLILMATIGFVVYDIRVKNQETSILLNKADSIAEARSLSKSIRTVQDSAVEELAAFNQLTLSRDKLVLLIEDIEKEGRALGLETDIISVGKVEDKKSTSTDSDLIRIVMEAQGPWASTVSFLHIIENLPHRVMIEESSFSKIETLWRLKIVLSLYSFD